MTLTCSANPPGWPPPQYRWWRDPDANTQGSSQTVLATGAKYMIPSAHMGSEGRYHCQATNEMGHGEPHSVVLQVHQPPRLVAKLQPHVTRRAGSADFSVKCGAQGKPKPVVTWLKVGSFIGNSNFGIYRFLKIGRQRNHRQSKWIWNPKRRIWWTKCGLHCSDDAPILGEKSTGRQSAHSLWPGGVLLLVCKRGETDGE